MFVRLVRKWFHLVVVLVLVVLDAILLRLVVHLHDSLLFVVVVVVPPCLPLTPRNHCHCARVLLVL